MWQRKKKMFDKLYRPIAHAQWIPAGIFTIMMATSGVAQEFVSPVHSTNQYINQLIFYRPYTQSAVIKEETRINVDISQSNIFQTSNNLRADFGLTTLDLTYYYPLSDTLELSFNYPVYHISKGFLDNFLDTVHNTLDITTTRLNDGHIANQFSYMVTDKINKTSAYFASGNPQIEIKYALYQKDDFFASVNAGVKIPLGSTSDGFTSGKVDVMSGLQLQKNYETISWIANFTMSYNGERELSSEITSERLRYFFYLANKFTIPLESLSALDFLFAYQFSSAPYEGSDVKFNSYTHLLQFALRKYLNEDEYIDFFFNQNTIPRHNEADVTFGLSYHF